MAPELVQLRLVTLYLTERCNSRCVSCDYWRHGGQDMALSTVEQLLPGLKALGVEQVLLSGGEPLLHPHWVEMATLLRAQGLKLWLLTAGLALAKQLDDVARHVEQVTVSLDGATAASYARIRGLDAFEVVCAGVRAAVRAGLPVTLRVTVQRGNVAELPALVRLAHGLGVNGISFLAADVAHDEAFGRQAPAPDGVALRPEDLPLLAASLDAIEQTHADDLAGGFIAESPAKLRRIEAHARARLGLGPLTAPRCNAPAHSAVIEADGRLRPCFFIGGTQRLGAGGLEAALNAPAERRLRAAIAAGAQAACERCVCAKWFAPA